MLRAILFDLDNTLVDRQWAVCRLCQDLLSDRGAGPEEVRKLLARASAREADYHLTDAAFWRWLAGQLRRWGVPPETLGRSRRRLDQYVSVDGRVCSMLRRLAERYKLAVVSNGSRQGQQAKMLRAGLSELFDVVLISGQMGVRKPDEAIFLQAVDKMGCPAEDAVFVGDDPLADISGAASAGLKTCWISRGRAFPADIPRPDWRITTVLDLPAVLPCLTPIN